MQLVQDRLNGNRPPPPSHQVDPKTGKLAPGVINNNKDLDVDARREEPSFFGSFFAGGKSNAAARKKPGAPVMESVSFLLHSLRRRSVELMR